MSGVKSIASGIFGSFGLFVLSSFIWFLGFILTFTGAILMYVAHRRGITAYTTQQVIPVVKEEIDTTAPTIGNVAKEITNGIKEGMKNTEDGGNNMIGKNNNSVFGHNSGSSISHSSNSTTSHNNSFGHTAVSHNSNGITSHSSIFGSSSVSHHSNGMTSHSTTTGHTTVSHNSDGSVTHNFTN